MIYGRKWQEYAQQWDTMIFNARATVEAERAAQYAIDNSSIYIAIEKETGVPWPLTACDHRRESDAQDKFGNPLFTSYLGNGQPLWKKTTIVPIGRGPFHKAGALPDVVRAAFIAGAKDAYAIDHLDRVKDWRLEKMLFWLESFNGAGYHNRGLPSPYIWGGTNIQKPGKYVGDGKWSGKTMDKQLGCAAILYCIAKLDPTVVYDRES